MIRVLFVCMGNICRSPMAEGTMRQLAKDAGLLDAEGGLAVDSAGTTRFHAGEPADRRATETVRAYGIDISAQRARQVSPEDFRRFDYVIALDRDNYAQLERIAPAGYEDRLSLLLDHAPGATPDEVPDPYYGGEKGFERSYALIEAGTRGLFDTLVKRHFPDRAGAS